MKSLKRYLSFLFAVVMIVSVAPSALAVDEEAVALAAIQMEIEEELSVKMESAARQLAAQGALSLLPTCEEVLREEITAKVMAVHYPNSINAVNTTTRMVNGGYVGYTTSLDTNVLKASYVPCCTWAYVAPDYFQPFTFDDILEDLIDDVLPMWNPAFEIVSRIETVSNAADIADIWAADGYSYTMRIHDPATDESGFVVFGWDDYPSVYYSGTLYRYDTFIPTPHDIH